MASRLPTARAPVAAAAAAAAAAAVAVRPVPLLSRSAAAAASHAPCRRCVVLVLLECNSRERHEPGGGLAEGVELQERAGQEPRVADCLPSPH